MVKPLSQDLRSRIVAAYENGQATYDQIAERFGVGRASVSRFLSRARSGEGLEPRPHGGGNPARIQPEEYDALRTLVAECPDATRADLCERWYQRFGVEMSLAAMGRALYAAGITRKKNGSVLRSNLARM